MIPTETGGYSNTLITLDITGTEVTIGSPSIISFEDVTSKSISQQADIELTGTGNYFWVDDLLGSDGGYATTIQMADMTNGATGLIDSSNIAILIPQSTVVTVAGSDNARVAYGGTLFNSYNYFSDTPLSFIYRNNEANSGLVGRYGLLPKLRLNISPFQELGMYTGVLTYTLF